MRTVGCQAEVMPGASLFMGWNLSRRDRFDFFTQA